MKKIPKWLFVSLFVIVSIISLPLVFLAHDMSIKDFIEDDIVWSIIFIVLIPFFGILLFFLAQHKIHNVSLQKRRKRLLIVLGGFIVFLLILTIIAHLQGIPLWQHQFQFANDRFGIQWLIIIAVFLYAFFRKEKKQKPTDSTDSESLK